MARHALLRVSKVPDQIDPSGLLTTVEGALDRRRLNYPAGATVLQFVQWGECWGWGPGAPSTRTVQFTIESNRFRDIPAGSTVPIYHVTFAKLSRMIAPSPEPE